MSRWPKRKARSHSDSFTVNVYGNIPSDIRAWNTSSAAPLFQRQITITGLEKTALSLRHALLLHQHEAQEVPDSRRDINATFVSGCVSSIQDGATLAELSLETLTK